MKNTQYLSELKQTVSNPRNKKVHLQEAVPWRVGQVEMEVGEIVEDGKPFDCIVLNKLRDWFVLKPSLMLLVPDIKMLYKIGSSVNGWLVFAEEARDAMWKQKGEGTCLAKAYFFGRPFNGRNLDLLARFFESGFSIEQIKGLPKFSSKMRIEVSVSDSELYTAAFVKANYHASDASQVLQTMNAPRLVKVRARFSTVIAD